MKIIQTKDYLLLIDEEAEIKEGNYRAHIHEKTLNHPVHRLEHGENTFDTWKLVLAYYPLTKEAKELDLPLLPNPFKRNWEKEYDRIRVEDENLFSMLDRLSFQAGYRIAQPKQFSLEDMKKAIEMAREGNFSKYYGCMDWVNSEEQIIQSLSTQQLPKEFIPEYEREHDDTVPFPKMRDSKTIKTITNIEGKKVLVGTYKY